MCSEALHHAKQLISYTRAIRNLKGWPGTFPLASMRRLEQTIEASRSFEEHDAQAASSIVLCALGPDSHLPRFHRYFYVGIATMLKLDLAEDDMHFAPASAWGLAASPVKPRDIAPKKPPVLILTPDMRVDETKPQHNPNLPKFLQPGIAKINMPGTASL